MPEPSFPSTDERIADEVVPSTPVSDDASTSPDDASGAPAPGGQTRRHFIRGIAATGATTVAAVALDSAGITHLLGDSAVAAGTPTPFSEFKAIAASSADQVEVPEGFRADILIEWGDKFENTDGTKYTYGFNNDFLAYLPIEGKKDEALLFANHEYPAPFFQHGNPTATTKTPEQIAIEKESVGNSILHIKRADGIWKVVSPSPYNRRITGDGPSCDITGPLRDTTQTNPTAVGGTAIIEKTAAGSLANCSGGITPWGTVLSCEENYSDYDLLTAFGYGWRGAGNEKYNAKNYAHYGWVVEHDPYDASSTPRKHTALGRFRHENTAFRAVAGKKFVLYMGDDKVNEGVYKFVSDREFLPGRRAHNLRILEEGTLYIAKWAPGGRRTFAKDGDVIPTSATTGTGEWIEILDSELVDTSGLLRQRFGADFDKFFATNRPEDVEVDVDGTVYIAFTNNSTVKDRHGSVRKLSEAGADPLATTFTWTDYANGGPTGRAAAGEQGVSCADNLVFDQANNLWVVTDISSASLKGSPSAAPYYEYHGNNAIFMVPRTGPNAGIGYRFANMPIDAEGTGPYFSDDFSTLFISVQHPGEETPARPGAKYGDPSTYTSWWPHGNKTANFNPSMPKPSTIAITRVAKPTPTPSPSPSPSPAPGGNTTIPVIPAPGAPGAPGTPGNPGTPSTPAPADPAAPTVALPSKVGLTAFLGKGLTATVKVGERTQIEARLRVYLPKSGRSKARWATVDTEKKTLPAGTHRLRLKPSTVARLALRSRKGKALKGEIVLTAKAVDGSPKKTTATDTFKIA